MRGWELRETASGEGEREREREREGERRGCAERENNSVIKKQDHKDLRHLSTRLVTDVRMYRMSFLDNEDIYEL